MRRLTITMRQAVEPEQAKEDMQRLRAHIDIMLEKIDAMQCVNCGVEGRGNERQTHAANQKRISAAMKRLWRNRWKHRRRKK